MKRNKIEKVITIDAAAKLEGEETGTVSEGIGFAMGGISQREIIENILLPKRVPIDSVVIKVGITDAIDVMSKKIYNSVPNVIERVKASVKRVPRKKKLIIIGVGNSSGIGNDKTKIDGVKDIVMDMHKKREEAKKKKKKRWFRSGK